MKFTWSWLKEHLDTTASPSTIAERLVTLGLEAHPLSNPGDALKSFKVAKIIEAEPHPNADKLRVCTVDYGADAPIQVVCGAPNARAGIHVVLGQPGTVVPASQMVLKEAEIRGVKSFGMLCSSRELGLGDEQDGIMELSSTLSPGMSFVEALELDDPLFQVDITPNRPDALGVRGVARDLAASGMGHLKPLPTVPIKEISTKTHPIQISKEADRERSCPVYMGRVLEGVANRSSPDWLQKRLKSIGMTPISALVDVTNFLCMDQCRPLHVFDYDTIVGPITVRKANDGEPFKGLDEKDYTLDPRMTVIADDEKILAIAGIMGGYSSRCTLETLNVLVESNYFDPAQTSYTGRRLGILSESRYRAERGVDPLSAESGLNQAVALMTDICGGKIGPLFTHNTYHFKPPLLSITPQAVERLTGITVTKDQIHQSLTALGCTIHGPETFSPPSWRPDIALPEDLVEEVARLHGYHHIPEADLPPLPAIELSPRLQQAIKARHMLADAGYTEVLTWSMTDHDSFKRFGGMSDDLQLTNPITIDLEYMRPSIVPGLLKALARNQARGVIHMRLFEIGPIYTGIQAHDQHEHLTGVVVGDTSSPHWSKEHRRVDFFDGKATVDMILKRLGVAVESLTWESQTIPGWFHPGQSAMIKQGPKNTLGMVGVLHPNITKAYDCEGPVVVFDLDLSILPLPRSKKKSALTLSPFQTVERDFAFIVPDDVPAEKLLASIRKIHPTIRDVFLFDVYQGSTIDAGHKSVAIKVMLEPFAETFTDAHIKGITEAIVTAAQRSVGARLRAQ